MLDQWRVIHYWLISSVFIGLVGATERRLKFILLFTPLPSEYIPIYFDLESVCAYMSCMFMFFIMLSVIVSQKLGFS